MRRGRLTAPSVTMLRRLRNGGMWWTGTTGRVVSTMRSVRVVTRARTSSQGTKTSDPAQSWWIPSGVRVTVPSPARPVARAHPR